MAHAVLVVIELLHHGGGTDARTRSRPEEVAGRWRDAEKACVSENNEGHGSVVDSLHEATRVLVRHEAHHLAIELLLCVLACHVRCRCAGFFWIQNSLQA